MSGSTGLPFVTGEMPTATQWNNIFAQFALTTGGLLNTPTLISPTISTIVSPTPIQFIIGGATIPFPGPAGPFLSLGGGTLAGTLGQTINTVLSGNWPLAGTGQLLNQTFSGAPAGGYSDPSGGLWIPLNSNIIAETVAFDHPASAVFGSLLRMQSGGSGATGGRVVLGLDFQNTGPISTVNQNDFYSCLQLSTYASYNITGSTALSPKGNYYGWNVFASAKAVAADSTAIYVAGLAGTEIDYTIEANASVSSGVGILLANFSPAGTTEINNGAGIVIGSTRGSGWKNYGLFFGNLQVGDTLPVVSSGSLIGAASGVVVNGLDFSAPTFTGQVIKGPNNFGVDANNTVHTDTLKSASDNSIGFVTSSGAGLFNMATSSGTIINEIGSNSTTTGISPSLGVLPGGDVNSSLLLHGGGTSGGTAGVFLANGQLETIAAFIGVANAVSGFSFTAAASGPVEMDVFGTGVGITIGGFSATSVTIGNATATTQILGTIKGAAGSFAANGSVATALSSLGPAGSHTTVQEWLQITDAGGTVRYIPCF